MNIISTPYIQPQPILYIPSGLRRFRAALGDAYNTPAPIICVGDSITFGQGSDNINATNAADYQWGYPAQLRALFSAIYGKVGEGFLMSGPSSAAPDTRITISGATTTNTLGPFGNPYKITNTQTVTLAVPATDAQGATITSVDVILWYQGAGGNQPPTYNFNSGASTGTCGVGAGSGATDTYYTGVTISTGGVAANLVITGPATAQAYVCGFILHSSVTSGVPVHRIGICGDTSGHIVGTSTGISVANQDRITRGLYQWASRVDTGCGTTNTSTTVTDPTACTGDVGKPIYGSGIPPGATIASVTAGTSYVISVAATATASGLSLTIGTPGLMIVPIGVNDQVYESGGGSSSQNGQTPAIYQANLQQLITKVTTDGWCVLLVGEPRNPSAATSADSEDAYYSKMLNLAQSNDHVSYIDIGAIWGPQASSHTQDMLLQHPSSVHPTRRGYGDMANILYNAITNNLPAGIANTVIA